MPHSKAILKLGNSLFIFAFWTWCFSAGKLRPLLQARIIPSALHDFMPDIAVAPHCQSKAWELYLFHIIIGPMAVGRLPNTSAFRMLHHPRILHMCSTNSRGTFLTRQTLLRTTCLYLSVCVPFRPCIWPVFCSSWIFVCSHSCSAACLSLWQLITAVPSRGHGSFGNAALFCFALPCHIKGSFYSYTLGHFTRWSKGLKHLSVVWVTGCTQKTESTK